MSNKKLLKWSVIGGAVILIGLSLGTIGFMYTKVKAFDNVFAQNVYVEDLAVGGLTKEEAKAKLEQNISDELSKQDIVFTNGEVSKALPLINLGIAYNIDETIDAAFKVGHEDGFFKQYKISQNGVEETQYFSLDRTIDENKIKAQLESCSESFYVAPINATMDRVNRKFVTTKEVNGATLDVDGTTQKFLKAMEKLEDDVIEGLTVEVVTKPILPECTEADLVEAQTLLASFSTSYNNADLNRNTNLKVAADKITRMILPEEIFYLSNQLEPFTEAEGYKNAGTIVNGKIEDSLGGGICQVASTLYNAVLLTELEVVYRQNHSLAVSYVPLGRDATYNTGSIDFKFKNNSKYPIYIEGYCENNEVIVNIYGYKDLKSDYTIKFESVTTEVIPAPQTKYEDDPTLEKGKEIVEVRGLDGKRVSLYKLYYQGSQLVDKVLVNRSYYRPRAAVIKRGTKGESAETMATPEGSSTPSPSEVPSTPTVTQPPTDNNVGSVTTPAPTPEQTPVVDNSQTPVSPAVEDSFAVPQS